MDVHSKVYIAGHRGLVGSALHRCLTGAGYRSLITKNSNEVDLRNQAAVTSFFAEIKPEYVFLVAAKVGGIWANNIYPAEFIYDNLVIQSNVIHQSYLHGVKKLIFFGSSCIYPKYSPQPMSEDDLLTGPLEPTNEADAIAKIAGIKMCQAYNRQFGTNFIAVMPTNLYGPGDNFDLETSHVLPALIRKFHDAKVNQLDYVKLWGTGTPRREFLFVDDLADACLFLMEHYHKSEIVNIGIGEDLTIKELATLVGEIVSYKGQIIWDSTKPDGTPRKLLNVNKLKTLGWQAKTILREGITRTYDWFKQNYL